MNTDFNELYNTYYMQVYSFVMTMTKNRNISEEITQQTFFKAISFSQTYRNEATELTWLCAISKNLFMDFLRKRKQTVDMPQDVVSDVDIENDLICEDSAFRIHQTLHDLEEPYKEVFSLRVFGELPFKKIGQLFGKSENWARVTYHRARLKIEERMKS